jgi:hypothetical protein
VNAKTPGLLWIRPEIGDDVLFHATVRVVLQQLWATGLFGETPAHTVERIVSMWLLENEDRVATLGIRLPSLIKEHS